MNVFGGNIEQRFDRACPVEAIPEPWRGDHAPPASRQPGMTGPDRHHPHATGSRSFTIVAVGTRNDDVAIPPRAFHVLSPGVAR